ncbi:hypothetical protein Ahu01nite_063730 [Winogradskya humida]|uniref:Uncharacterized protein n=1 Tax=Winogradskya humida TaxID=113566 RepID=A0ABQ3ZXG7_9ACTN|nr:hypothetical protein Ahu01nite_063730 [Actinoplanes humidus]
MGGGHTVLVPEPGEQGYLRQVELLARDVVAAAHDEGWLTYAEDPAEASGLQRRVNELARTLRHQHFEGDGCAESDRPVLTLGGAALLVPGANYRAGCDLLGVEAREEGWALWYTWDNKDHAHTMVTAALETTRGLLDNWAQGRDVHPGQPARSQIRAVRRGWIGPVTLSPGYAATKGLGGW